MTRKAKRQPMPLLVKLQHSIDNKTILVLSPAECLYLANVLGTPRPMVKVDSPKDPSLCEHTEEDRAMGTWMGQFCEGCGLILTGEEKMSESKS